MEAGVGDVDCPKTNWIRFSKISEIGLLREKPKNEQRRRTQVRPEVTAHVCLSVCICVRREVLVCVCVCVTKHNSQLKCVPVYRICFFFVLFRHKRLTSVHRLSSSLNAFGCHQCFNNCMSVSVSLCFFYSIFFLFCVCIWLCIERNTTL